MCVLHSLMSLSRDVQLLVAENCNCPLDSVLAYTCLFQNNSLCTGRV
jgi:hypothetical protein